MEVKIKQGLVNLVTSELGYPRQQALDFCAKFVDRLQETRGLDQIDYSEIETTDDLEQAFAERKERRHDGLIQDVLLAELCCEIGGGVAVAVGASTWSKVHITKLAKMALLPVELLDPEMAVGVYHTIARHTDTAADAALFVRRAINEGWGVADAKEAFGVSSERTAAPRFKASLARNDDGELVVTPDEPPDYVPARVEVREVAT